MNGYQDWLCEAAGCEEDARLYIFAFREAEPTDLTEGTALCFQHLAKTLNEAVLDMTDDHPELHHVILCRP